MSGSSDNIVIDLTKSFTLADHCLLSNEVIDLLDDDTLLHVTLTAPAKDIQKSKRYEKERDMAKKRLKKRKNEAASPISEKKNKLGGCPICWDELGKNPLASTKCGHVYCISCLEEFLKIEKKCPTCRRSLKGSSSYHPLYLG